MKQAAPVLKNKNRQTNKQCLLWPFWWVRGGVTPFRLRSVEVTFICMEMSCVSCICGWERRILWAALCACWLLEDWCELCVVALTPTCGLSWYHAVLTVVALWRVLTFEVTWDILLYFFSRPPGCPGDLIFLSIWGSVCSFLPPRLQ